MKKSHLVSLIKEISSDLFKSAAMASQKRGTHGRTQKLTSTYFDNFIGKPLLGGKISNITSNHDMNIVVYIENAEIDDTEIPTYTIRYYPDQDYWNLGEKVRLIERTDARMLSLIAQKINPNTKYKNTTMHFDIKGY